MDTSGRGDARPVATGTAAEPETVVPLNTARSVVALAVGLLIVLGFAAGFSYAAATTHSAPKRGLAIVVAAFFAVLSGGLVIGGLAALTPRSLNVGPAGVRYVSRRRPWSLRWDQLSTVGIEVGYTMVGRGSLVPARFRRVYAVRVVLETTPDCVASKMLERFRGRFGATPAGYGFPLGPQRKVVPALDAALRAHGGRAYRGVQDLGDMRGDFL